MDSLLAHKQTTAEHTDPQCTLLEKYYNLVQLPMLSMKQIAQQK